jgi:hypothetical protein
MAHCTRMAVCGLMRKDGTILDKEIDKCAATTNSRSEIKYCVLIRQKVALSKKVQ